MNRGAGGGGAAGLAGGGVAGVAVAAGAAGLLSTAGGRGGATGAVGAGGAVAACCFCVISLRTSPGLEMWERSILVLISSDSRPGRDARDGALASADARKWFRTFSASWSSSELECVFFSVTPTSVRTSRMALLLTSSSLARSLIRILLIRPFFAPPLLPKSSSQPRGVSVAQRATAYATSAEFRDHSFGSAGFSSFPPSACTVVSSTAPGSVSSAAAAIS
jgi:hypothetical protein